MPVRPTLLHRMALVSFLLFRKNLGNLREFFGQMVYPAPWQKISRTPMVPKNPIPAKIHVQQTLAVFIQEKDYPLDNSRHTDNTS